MSQLPPRFLCRHIRPTGARCGSPSLRNEHFCYFHHTTRRPPAAPVTDPELLHAGPTHATFELPSLEDRPSIHLAIQEVARRIALNQLDPRRAALLLYALRIASANLPREPRETRTTHSRTSAHSQDPQAPEPLIESFETHPTHGPIAPIAEIASPDEDLGDTPFKSLFEQWLESLPERHAKTPDEVREQAQTIPKIQAVAESLTADSSKLKTVPSTVFPNCHIAPGRQTLHRPQSLTTNH
jgi:hypothetical protein